MTAIQKTPPVPGSLAAQSQASGQSLAETFVNADVIVLVDTSGSMGDYDGSELTRYARACNELKKIQASMPGKIAVISFSNEVLFCPSGVPYNFGNSTRLEKALAFARVVDIDGITIIVISDGQPDDERECLDEARKYQHATISTIYIGPAGECGEKFLARLAQIRQGKAAQDFAAHQLAVTVRGLLA